MDEESDNGWVVTVVIFILAFIFWGGVTDFLITVIAESSKITITSFSSQMLSMTSGGTLTQTGKNIEFFTVLTIDFLVAILGAIGTVVFFDKISKLLLRFLDLITSIFGGSE